MLNDLNWINYFSIVFLTILFLLSCKQNTPTPKPKGYFRIEFPTKDSSQTFTLKACDFTFEYPNYATVEQDTLFFDEKPDHPCWLNITYPTINGMVHMSYKSLYENDLDKLTEDYHTMTNKHVIKADYIDERVINDTILNKYGLISSVGGNVASPYQFYITDSSTHYVRGALYFKAEANADSLKPAVDFVVKDLVQLIGTLEWNN